jgi:hypothetical protein
MLTLSLFQLLDAFFNALNRIMNRAYNQPAEDRWGYQTVKPLPTKPERRDPERHEQKFP